MSTDLSGMVERVRVIGVLGSGQMGGGIAQVAASSGFTVQMSDVSIEAASKGKERIGAALTRQVEKGKMPADARDALLGRITPVAGPAAFGGCDLVIEAATENFELKVKLLKECDAVMPPHAILASNTSSISLTKLAAATSRPGQVVGMHFMNPPPLMKLVEIVRGIQTTDATHAVVAAIAAKMDKTVITSKDMPGFLVNRVLIPFLNEACFALQEGLATPEDIDTGSKLGLNHPMGPFELADLIGLDTVLFIAETFQREFGDDKYRPATLLRNLVAAGWLGRKTKRGFYTYDDKGTRTGRAFG